MDKFRGSSCDHISDLLSITARSWRSRKVLSHLWSLCGSMFLNMMWFSRGRKSLVETINELSDVGMWIANGSFIANETKKAKSCQLPRPQDRSLIVAKATIWTAIVRRYEVTGWKNLWRRWSRLFPFIASSSNCRENFCDTQILLICLDLHSKQGAVAPSFQLILAFPSAQQR